MKLFILVRILDIITTLYGINHGQFELNPFNARLINFGSLYFILWNILIIWLISLVYKYPLIKFTVNIFTIINAIVVAMNITMNIIIIYELFNT